MKNYGGGKILRIPNFERRAVLFLVRKGLLGRCPPLTLRVGRPGKTFLRPFGGDFVLREGGVACCHASMEGWQKRGMP